MPVGDQPSQGNVNATLGGLSIQLRQLCQEIRDQFEYLEGLNTAGLEALGFTSGDATAVLAMISYLNTIAGVYFGTATQGSTFDFDSALSVLWGGQ